MLNVSHKILPCKLFKMRFFVTKHTSETSLQVFSPVVTGMSQHVWKDPNLVNNSFGKTKRDPDTGSFYQYPGVPSLYLIKKRLPGRVR